MDINHYKANGTTHFKSLIIINGDSEELGMPCFQALWIVMYPGESQKSI
jgi:hypothetical protein